MIVAINRQFVQISSYAHIFWKGIYEILPNSPFKIGEILKVKIFEFPLIICHITQQNLGGIL